MFTDLFEAVPDALVLTDGAGRIVRANQQALRLFGYERDELQGASIETLVPESARARHRLHRIDYMAHPHVRAMGVAGMSLSGRRHDGTRFPLEIALSPIDDEGEVRYLASIRDISDSTREKQAATRARYDSLAARYGQLALESRDQDDVIAHVPLLLMETLGIESVLVVFLSPETGRFDFRASAGFSGPAQVDSARLLAALKPARMWVVEDFSREPGPERGFPVSPCESGSGVLVPLLDLGFPMGALLAYSSKPYKFDHDAQHLLQSFASLIAALEQRFRTQNQLAHVQRLDALGKLTGGIAHDLNNLLTIMSGNLQLLESEYPGTSGARELIDSVLHSVGRGADLTGKLLSFARRQRLVPRPLDLKTILRDVEQMLGRTLGSNVRISMCCPDALPNVHADPAQLDTVLLNLVLNARDAMPQGGEIAIEARLLTYHPGIPASLQEGDYLLITVSDTGCGMSSTVLAHAMEPFFTTKGAGQGSGLGLSMAHGFARQSGGDLWIESKPGHGTTVHLCLPVDRCREAGQAERFPSLPRAAGETILVVEDDYSVRRIAVAFLRRAGYRVKETASFDGALVELEADARIDLLFTDVLLGQGGNGYNLALAARNIRPDLAILLTSGFERSSTSQQLEQTQFELLRKPYRREQLLDAVRRQLDLSAVPNQEDALPAAAHPAK